jgi:hypothetical protein
MKTEGAWFLGLSLSIATGCVSVTGLPVAELQGTWHGRTFGAAGNAPTVLVIRPDGRYTATVFLDAEDRQVSGSIVALPSGRLRYLGTDGDGNVLIQGPAGRREIQLLRDGGGGGSRLRQTD